MPTSRIIADLLTDTHRISCRIDAGSLGIFGMLNDSNTSVFQVEDAYISRLQQPAKIVEHRPTAFVAKALVAVGLLARREDLGLKGLAHTGYTQVNQYPVLITTSAFEIRCQLEMAGKLEVAVLLSGGTGRFLAAYKANLLATALPDIPYTSEVVFINRSLVQLIAPDPGGKLSG